MMLLSFLIITLPFCFSTITFIHIKSYYILAVFIILYAIILFSIAKGGCLDPGIIPRQLGKPHPFRRKTDFIMVSNGSFVKFSYCYTCNIIKPPRASHCAKCDNCCQRFDHHCLWLGNCIGKRNYKYFFLLLTTLIINCIIGIIYNICIIVQSVKDKEEKKIKFRIFTISVLAGITFYELMFLIIFLGRLFFVHIRLVFKNITFYEHIKHKLINPAKHNPFYKSISQNLYRLLIALNPKSLLNGHIRRIRKAITRENLNNNKVFSPYINDKK